MVEIQLDLRPGETSQVLLVIYAINTTLLVAVHLLALMIGTCILPNIESYDQQLGLLNQSPINAQRDASCTR